MSNKTINIIAAFLLAFVFVVSLLSVKGDSLTMDELAHLPAGYSYLTQKDMRLNPEHPPLVKDLAAFPLLFIRDINFPAEAKAWQEEVNSQWDFGREFLFRSNNPADQIIFWGRIPMILMLVLLGFYLFKWARELFGNKAALLALTLFSFSPTFLAHGSLITTDVAAAAGILIATYYFLKTLQSPSKKNIIIAGIAFGIAQLLKFSVILLVPLFGFLALAWWLLKKGVLKQVIKTLVLVFLIGFLLIWPVYQYHTWNYPAEKQLADTQVYLRDSMKPFQQSVLWMSDKLILRPFALYLTGLGMIFHRVAGGNTTYFLGQVSNLGWLSYFPAVYLMKVPLTFHILTLAALLFALFWLRKNLKNTIHWITSHFPEFTMIGFVGLYWVVSIAGKLNIGVRHLLPVFPFTIILVSAVTVHLLKNPDKKLKCLLLALLIIWQLVSVFSVYPHFLAYFNEAVGGAENGHKYVVDSNLDWGQDLKRLKLWLEENKIERVYLDYFGGAEPQYYLKEKYAPWWGQRPPEELPKGSYLAISATFLQGGKGEAIPTLPQSSGFYHWLNNYQPIARIGYSIFVYYIK